MVRCVDGLHDTPFSEDCKRFRLPFVGSDCGDWLAYSVPASAVAGTVASAAATRPPRAATFLPAALPASTLPPCKRRAVMTPRHPCRFRASMPPSHLARCVPICLQVMPGEGLLRSRRARGWRSGLQKGHLAPDRSSPQIPPRIPYYKVAPWSLPAPKHPTPEHTPRP